MQRIDRANIGEYNVYMNTKILTFDTSTETSSIALADEAGLIGEYNIAHKMDLSSRMMPNIMALLKDCRTELTDLGAIGVSLGPGSFTGLRIGVVTGKTLAQALGVPIVGVTSLDILAHQFDFLPNKLVCPIIKVRKGEVYYAFYRTHLGGLERLSEYAAETVESLIEHARQIDGGDIIFCGDALNANLPALREGLGDLVVPASPWLCYPKASVLARVALEKLASGRGEDPLTLVPFYIRKSTPEMKLEGKA